MEFLTWLERGICLFIDLESFKPLLFHAIFALNNYFIKIDKIPEFPGPDGAILLTGN